jgi:hypothetical protein
MRINSLNHAVYCAKALLKICALSFLLLFTVGCGVETDNEFLDAPENIVDTSKEDSNAYKPLGEIPDISLTDISVRGRPYIDDSLGYNVIRSDMGTLLRGVSLSTDGGDPYNALNLLEKPDIKLESLQSMVNDYGFNTLHVYLEGDAAQNPDPVGINEELADHLVEITRQAKMYLIITIGNNGENGAIHSMEKVLAFWDLYGTKYKDETHVIYEAHNEPVSGINGYWTDEDWKKQADMYEKIREVAPDTMVLLGSFMSFFGGSQAIKGANDLAAEFPGIWDNAGFAFHAYWDLGQVESTIEAFEASDDYPALLCTEFWPGDTKNGFNEVFESHQIGWTQFEWLGGNDLELDRVKNYLDTYGTAWRPDNPNSTWPASGSPSIPIDQTIGLYSRVDKKFLGLDDQDRVVAGDQSYDGVGSDEFIVVDAGDDGHIALLADNGRYLSVSDYGQPLVASARKIGVKQKFMWLELSTGDIALRPWAGSGHLIGTIASTDGDEFGLTGSVGAGIKRGGANSYRVVTAYTNSVDPLPEIPPVPPGPFFGAPMPVPTNGDHNLPTSAPDNRLYASDYDIGGEGISYHDTGAINLGEAYRPSEGVDVESSNEGHTSVGFFEEDEWLQYTIDVAQAGNYIVTLRTASAGGGFISLESDCRKLTDNLATPDTGWWDIWQDITVDVTLEAGEQKLRVVSGGNMNLMNMDIQLGGNGGADYGAGCEWQPPEPDDLKVEAEDWTTVVSAPEGSVNINAVATDSDLSLHVGNFDAGDFIEYAVGLPETSCYRAEYRVASYTGSDGFELIFDGETADSFKIPQTGGWDSWVTFTRHYELNAGSQTLRLEALGDSFNVNWLRFNATDAVDCEQSDTIIVEAETYISAIEQPDGDVGTQATDDEGGGLNVGWIDAGDWMEYEINVIESGNYSVSYRMASQAGSSSGVNILIDGNQADTTFVPNTGGWQKWQTVDGGTISLEAGQYVLRFEAPGGGLNLNWIKFTPAYQIPTGNIGTGLNDSLDEGETINFNDPVVNYGLINIGDSLANLEVDSEDDANTVVSVIKGAVASSGVNIASGQVNYPLSATLVRLSMRVYSSTVGTSVRTKLEDSSDSAHSVETETLTTVANEWETLVFDFRNPVEGTAALDTDYNFDVLSVFFNYSASGNGETYYLDDITMLEAIKPPIAINAENSRIEAEDWFDVIPEPRSVGIQETQDISGDYNLGWIAPGDWMEYEFTVANSGNYELALRVATPSASLPTYKISIDDVWVDDIEVANTGGYQTWQTMTGNVVALDQGVHTLRIDTRSPGANLNWIELIETTDQADTLPVPVPSITSSDLIGSWKLAPVAGALFVDGWSSSLGDVSTRYCLFDDLFTFYGNGAFTNQMNSLTWVEQWQGVSDGCGTPIYPHDGRGRSSFTFDEAAMTITLNGKGAHLGIPKAVNGAEYGAGISLAQAPESIVYDVIESTATTMSIKINIQGGKYWIFKLIKN